MVLLAFDEARAVFTLVEGEKSGQILVVELKSGAPKDQNAKLLLDITHLAGKQFQLLLSLPKENVFRRTITVPLALEENLRQALSFELDRYTPFKPDQAYFDFCVIERLPALRQLKVDLAVVKRSVVDASLNQAMGLGLRPSRVVLGNEVLRNGIAFNFMPAATGNDRTSPRPWWRLGLALITFSLLVVLLVIPPWQKRATAIGLLGPLAQAKASAGETNALRDRMDRLVEEHNLLPDKKWAGHSVVLVLDELSVRLKDDTYLTHFEYDGKTLAIQGESSSAAALVEVLEASPAFKDVVFKSQLTKIQGTPYDRFHIVAMLKNEARPKPPSDETVLRNNDESLSLVTAPNLPTSSESVAASPLAPAATIAPQAPPATAPTPDAGAVTNPVPPAASNPATKRSISLGPAPATSKP